jgi:predicted nucleotidyltransferase
MHMEIRTIDFQQLAQQFDGPGVNAIVLMGSHARGDAGPYSDVDLVRFVDESAAGLAAAGSHLLDGILVVVSNVTPPQVESWFTQAEAAVKNIAGVRLAQALIDRQETFAAIQARALEFVWTTEHQHQADKYASEQMVGWIEEVHKGLEGLRRFDVGRLLNALHGLTWGMSGVMQVQRGILITGDNGFYNEIAAALGEDSLWVRLRAVAFGVADVNGRPASLRERVVAGLGLYVVTAELLGDAIQPEHEPLIAETVEQINTRLQDAYHGE